MDQKRPTEYFPSTYDLPFSENFSHRYPTWPSFQRYWYDTFSPAILELENFHDLWEKECRNSKGTNFSIYPSRNLTNSKISLEKPMRWKMKLQSFSEKFGLNFKGALLLCMSVLSTFLASFRGRGMYRFGPLDSLDSAGVFFGEFGFVYLGCDIGGAKELGVMYFLTNWGAKEPQNPPNHRVVMVSSLLVSEFGKGAGLMKGRGEFQTPKVDISTSHPMIWLFQFSSVFPYIL